MKSVNKQVCILQEVYDLISWIAGTPETGYYGGYYPLRPWYGRAWKLQNAVNKLRKIKGVNSLLVLSSKRV